MNVPVKVNLRPNRNHINILGKKHKVKIHAYYMIQQRAKASVSVCWVLISSEEH